MLVCSNSLPVASRAGALALALLQLTAFTILPAVDALLDAEPIERPAHVESERSAACAPAHDHSFCQAVRSLTAAGRTPAIGEAERVPASVVSLRPRSAGEAAPRRFLTRSIGSRAPPLA